jgi:hypothetical protein
MVTGITCQVVINLSQIILNKTKKIKLYVPNSRF